MADNDKASRILTGVTFTVPRVIGEHILRTSYGRRLERHVDPLTGRVVHMDAREHHRRESKLAHELRKAVAADHALNQGTF